MNELNTQHEFAPFDDNKWRELAKNELKGKALDDLTWHTRDGFDISPISFPPYKNDWKENGIRRGLSFSSQERSICSSHRSETKDLNNELLNALQNGANAIEITGPIDELDLILKNVHLEMIQIHFVSMDPLGILEQLHRLAAGQGLKADQITGSISGFDMGDKELVASVSTYCDLHLPRFRCLALAANIEENLLEQLEILLYNGTALLDDL